MTIQPGSQDPAAATRSLVGERSNPHPSQGSRYIVEVIDQDEGEVLVRYVHDRKVGPWWITEAAWKGWREYSHGD